MRREFGANADDGSIMCKYSFTGEMSHLCGREYVIECIDTATGEVELVGFEECWTISEDMIEPVVPECEDFVDDVSDTDALFVEFARKVRKEV